MKRGAVILTLIIVFVLLITSVLAEVSFDEQPKSTYNIGDDLYFSLLISGKGVMDIDLICGEQLQKIYLNTLDSADGKQVPVVWSLDNKQLIGECIVSALFNEQIATSQSFFISNQSYIELRLKDINVEPGKSFEFQGTARKENLNLLQGFAEISLDESNISTIREVINGSFSGSLRLPHNIASGHHKLKTRVYEKNEQGEIINQGFYEIYINIKQIPNSIDIATNNLDLKPGEILLFTPKVYDQGGQEISNQTINLIIRDSQGKRIKEFISDTSQGNEFKLMPNAISGYWTIEAFLDSLIEKKEFYVKTNQEAKFEIMNNTLVITNIGNVPYKKTIEVKIGDETRIKTVELNLNESVKFKLSAPKGEYNIEVDDGKETFSTSGVALTGRAIGISKMTGSAISQGAVKSIIWIFIIIVLGFFIFILFKKKKKGKFTLSMSNIKEKLKERKLKKDKTKAKLGKVKIEPEETTEVLGKADKDIKTPVSKTADAVHSLVLKGHKQNSAIIALQLKNRAELLKSKTNAWQTIKKVIDEIKDNKGKIYFTEGYIIGIFAPVITKTFRNEQKAIEVASEIGKILSEHNKKFIQKINFGLAVNTGELIVQKKENNLLFTPIANTIALAKKIAKIANKELLLSKPIHEKLLSEVKTEKHEKKGTPVYSITRVTDRNKQHKFIQEFIKRQEAEKKAKKKK